MNAKFLLHQAPVDSISLLNPFIDRSKNLEMTLEVLPGAKIQFWEQDICNIDSTWVRTGCAPSPWMGPRRACPWPTRPEQGAHHHHSTVVNSRICGDPQYYEELLDGRCILLTAHLAGLGRCHEHIIKVLEAACR